MAFAPAGRYAEAQAGGRPMDWAALRDAMPVTRRWAFFDHAAVAPLTAAAARTLAECAADFADNGIAAVPRWVARVGEARQRAGRLLNADPHDVAFVPNTTAGVGLVAEGFPWKPGDNVVLPEEEYPSNQYAWMNLAHRGVTARRVPSRGSRVLIDDLRAAMDGRTRILAVSSVEFASGYRNDLDALGAMCHERGAYLFVDAIQSLGVLPLDVQRTPVDFLSADGHKWMLGPEGAGVFWVRPELVEMLHPIGVGWKSVVQALDFARIDFALKPHAGRWEGGTLNTPGVAALGASLGLLLDIGIDAVAERVLHLTDILCERAARAGLRVFSSRAPAEKSGIASLELPGVDVAALVARCREAGIIVNHRAGRLRVSPHCYNTEDELERLIDVLKTAR
jgi:selenocysteine lyase/cysteine desulfurase